MLAEPTDRRITEALARAIAGIGSDQHVERMVDLIRELVPQDLVTVTRYSTTQRPEFVSHRNFSDAMVQRYLEIYYLHDPFFHFWRRHRRPGVVPLKSFAGPDVKRGRYVAEFLAHSVICDEVGVLLEDGPGWCLGIFLDRSKKAFSSAEITRLEGQFPVFAALHALDTKSRRPGFMRTSQPPAVARQLDDNLPQRHLGRNGQEPPAQHLPQARYHHRARAVPAVFHRRERRHVSRGSDGILPAPERTPPPMQCRHAPFSSACIL